jgi:hypothetical protein
MSENRAYRTMANRRPTTSAEIPPGTPPPKVSAEVWGKRSETEYDVLEIADVVRINDTWHVVVVVDD